MAAVQQRILNWLYSVLTSEYHDVNRTYNDIAQALSHYSSLTPRTEVYTYENGASALLLQLSGTLPVVFRGTTYRFPVALWIPHAYPQEAPLIYVVPAEGMAVRAGQHVDPQGKVYHPYLVGWAGFAERSNVLDFLAILRDIFAKEPPVVASQQHRPMPPSTSQPPPRPPPPPSGLQRGSPQPSISGFASPPPPPPKPYAQAETTQNTHDGGRSSGPPLPPLPPGIRPSSNQQGPPLPYHHSTQSPFQPQRQSSLRYEAAPPLPGQQQRPVSTYTSNIAPHGSVSSSNGQGQYPDPPRQQYHLQSPAPYHASYHPGQQPPLGYPPQQYQQHPPQPQTQQPKPKPVDLMDEPLTLSIPSPTSSNLPAPPVPTNPEKDMLLQTLGQALYAQRQKSLSQTTTSLPGLSSQHNAMLNALQNLQSEVTQLTQLSQTLNSNTNILHTALRSADQTIATSATKEPPKIDEILVAPTVVGNQLYREVCEERAIADTIFVLGRAVERGRIGTGTFVKGTRGLAREWFEKKLLVRKIGRGMGLDLTVGTYGR